MTQPKLSVLMSAYNVEDYIAQAISSILDQSFSDFEFLIVDDASTDNTLSIIKDFAAKDDRIKFFVNQANQGLTKNRNFLLSQTNSPYVVWQDGDDVAEDGRLEGQFNFMEAHPEVGICGGYLLYFGAGMTDSTREYAQDDNALRQKVFRFAPASQGGSIIRREVFDKTGPYDESLEFAEDVEMTFRIGEHYKFANLPQVVLRYRQHPESSTFRKLKTIELNTLKMRWHFSKSKHYHARPFDYLFNLGQLVTLFIFPAKWRIAMFNFVRNKF